MIAIFCRSHSSFNPTHVNPRPYGMLQYTIQIVARSTGFETMLGIYLYNLLKPLKLVKSVKNIKQILNMIHAPLIHQELSETEELWLAQIPF